MSKLITPEQFAATRRQRATDQYSAYHFSLHTARVRTRSGDAFPLAVVHVHAPSGRTYTVQGRNCDCPDACRRRKLGSGSIPCKHYYLTKLWLEEREAEFHALADAHSRTAAEEERDSLERLAELRGNTQPEPLPSVVEVVGRLRQIRARAAVDFPEGEW